MYLPAQFEQDDEELTQLAMRESPFATLVSVIPGHSEPYISQLPIVVTEASSAENSRMILLGHLAKPNPHSKVLEQAGSHQLLFTGPNAYMSPSVYEDKNKVPTWTYISVLAQGSITLVQGHDALDKLLKALIAQHEPAYAEQWRGIALNLQEKLLSAIVGFSFEVTRLESKFKLNQHRPESHEAMAAQLKNGVGLDAGKALARWMERLGLV
jgi:transcriptional regulator